MTSMRLAGMVWILMSALMAGCSGRRDDPLGREARKTNPEEILGYRAFMVHCNKCHPGGGAGLGPGIIGKPLPGFMIHLQVREGYGAMPAFPRETVSDAELDAIILYIDAVDRS